MVVAVGLVLECPGGVRGIACGDRAGRVRRGDGEGTQPRQWSPGLSHLCGLPPARGLGERRRQLSADRRAVAHGHHQAACGLPSRKSRKPADVSILRAGHSRRTAGDRRCGGLRRRVADDPPQRRWPGYELGTGGGTLRRKLYRLSWRCRRGRCPGAYSGHRRSALPLFDAPVRSDPQRATQEFGSEDAGADRGLFRGTAGGGTGLYLALAATGLEACERRLAESGLPALYAGRDGDSSRAAGAASASARLSTPALLPGVGGSR